MPLRLECTVMCHIKVHKMANNMYCTSQIKMSAQISDDLYFLRKLPKVEDRQNIKNKNNKKSFAITTAF